MKGKKSIFKNKIFISIIISIFVIAGGGYYRLFIIPKQELQNILSEFEIACRNQNITKLHEIVSDKAMIYKHLSGNKIKELFSKFEPNINVTRATFVPAYGLVGQSIIQGEAEMFAKKDGKNRVFDLLFIEKHNGAWKITQFGFPDYINY